MNPAYQVLSVNVARELNRVPWAELTLRDGDAAQRKFEISNSDFFAPGSNIEIKIGWQDQPQQTVFKGVVVRLGVESDASGSSLLAVGLKDAALKLTGARHTAVFRQQTDSDIITKLISDAGLKSGTVKATSTQLKQVVQYQCTDWDFILARAEANGQFVSVDGGTISTTDLSASGAPVASFKWGMDPVYSFDFEADASNQFAQVSSVGWDGNQIQPTSPANAANVPSSPGNLSMDTIASKIGMDSLTLTSMVPMEQSELSDWAKGFMARTRAAAIRGRMSVSGINVKLVDVIEIGGVSDRFNGNAVVTGISDQVTPDGWTTHLQFGVSPKPVSAMEGIMTAPAAGLLPAVRGLQVGVVQSIDNDPDNEYRIELQIPGVSQGDNTVWARMCSLDAGNKRGHLFRPEVGDEVAVAFFNEDPRYPVILGALYSSKNAPPDALIKDSDKNTNKGIVTRSGITIAFDDDKKTALIQTPAKNQILLDDGNQAIKLTDQNNNTVTLDSNGITLKSAKDIAITAGGNVKISGTAVDVK